MQCHLPVTTCQAMHTEMQQDDTVLLSNCSHRLAQGEQHPHNQSEQALYGAGCWLESGRVGRHPSLLFLEGLI